MLRALLRRMPWSSVALSITLICSIISCYKIYIIEKRQARQLKAESPFLISNVYNGLKFSMEWEFTPDENRIAFVNALFDQPFHWLGKGQQVFAFLSQDGQYVLKFFQMQRLQGTLEPRHVLQRHLPQSDERATEVTRRRKALFESSKLAYLHLQEETGMVFAHLNRTHNMLRDVLVYDIHGNAHTIQADSAAFVIQKRARYIMPTISELMFNHRIDEAQRRIDQILTLLVRCADKGIIDQDWALVRNNNLGFLDDCCIYIDSGNMTQSSDHDRSERLAYDVTVRLKPFYQWLQLNYPELAAYYEERCTAILSERGFGVDQWGNAHRLTSERT